jgi:hypothetical protein
MILISRPTTCANQIAVASRMPRSQEVHTSGRIVRDGGDAPVRFRLRHQLPVIGADDGGIERAFELLQVLLLARVTARARARRRE